MSSTSLPALSLAPLHLLTYSSLLGMELYQTFILTRLNHRALPLPQFRALQARVFPLYFTLQLLLSIAVAATQPPYSFMSLLLTPSSWWWLDAMPLALMGGTAGLNWAVYGPRTALAMAEVARQETRDGRGYADGVQGEEMKAVMRGFSKAHAMSIHINLVTIIATVWYGFVLASKLSYRSTRDSKK